MPLSLTRIVFVDGSATSPPDGSLDKPYPSIQAAVSAVPVPATVAESVQEWMILIAPGDYDEDVTITGAVRLALIGLGAFRLGRYTAAGGTQTNIVAVADSTPRNLVWSYEIGQVISDGAAPQLVIGTIGGTDVVRPGKPIANRISGSIIIRGTAVSGASGGTAFLSIANTQVDAGIKQDPSSSDKETDPTQPAIDVMGFSGVLVDRHFNSRFRGEIRGPLNDVPATDPAYRLATSFRSLYEQLVQVTGYASIEQAGIERGMTVSQVPNLGSLKSVLPPGMVNSTFTGEFTGPAGSLLLDAVTNTWFIRNGAKLAGGATKRFLDGASQTLAIHRDIVLQYSDCGVTLLANATRAPISVTLPSAVGKDDLTFTIKNVTVQPFPHRPPPSPYPVIVAPAPDETIDGWSSLALGPALPPGAPSAIKIVASHGHWWIVARG
jgi:hypothetical protein